MTNKVRGGCALIIAVGIAALVLLLAGGADATTNINSCKDITAAGEYVLNASILNSGASSCINITSSDVVFNGAGYTIEGVNGLNTKGVNVSNISTALTNVTVTNLTVTAWGYGIFYNNTANGNITDNNASSNTRDGIYMDSSNNNNLSGNNANSNTRDGFSLHSIRNNNLSGNNASNNNYSIYMEFSSNNNLSGNNANSNKIDGIYMNSSSNNSLSGNNANSNTRDGFSLHSIRNNNLSGNNVSNNDYGIYMESSSSNNLTINTAKNNVLWDFYSRSNSTNNIVTNLEIGSTVISFESKDIAMRNAFAPAPDPANLHNISKYINATNNSADSWIFLNVSYNNTDLGSVIASTLNMSKYNGSWITDPSAFANNFGVNTAENYVFANITNFGSIFVPLGVQKQSQPVPAISTEGVVVLTGMLCFTAMVALRRRKGS